MIINMTNMNNLGNQISNEGINGCYKDGQEKCKQITTRYFTCGMTYDNLDKFEEYV